MHLTFVRPALLVSVLALASMAGCSSIFGTGSAPPANAWVAGEMTSLTDRTAKFDDRTVLDEQNRVSLFAAGNETIGLQVVVDAGPDGLAGLQLAASAFKTRGGKSLPPGSVSIFRMLPVRVTEFPAWYLRLTDAAAQPMSVYDALVPIGAPKAGQPFSAGANERLAFWVDVSVPRDAAAGEYSATLTIQAGRHADRVIPINLQVYGFVLPNARPIVAVGGFDHQTLFETFIRQDGKPYEPVRMDRNNALVLRGLGIMRQMMVLSHEHRLDLFEKTLHPIIRHDMPAQVQLDWDDYDNIVTPYLGGTAFDDRIGCPAWPVPFSEGWPWPGEAGSAASSPQSNAGSGEDYVATVRQLLAQSAEHFRSLGAADQMFVWPYRGPVEAKAFDQYAAMAGLVRSVDPQTPLLTQLPPAPPPMTLWTVPDKFDTMMDIAAPPAQWLDTSWPAKYAKPGSTLRGVWLSPGLPPYLPSLSIASSPAGVRALPWFAMKYGCTGLFLPEVLNWSGDVFASPAGAETRLFYPGSKAGIDGVLPSVRLKRLRRGLQDISYLWILKQRERAAIAQSFINSLVRYAGQDAAGDNYQDVRLGGWAQDGQVWEMARRLMAEETQAAVHPDAPVSARLLALQLAWKDFDEKIHAIRVEQVRSFVRQVGDKLQATVLLDLYNEYNRDVDVSVKLEDLPAGWQGKVGLVKVSSMAPGSRKTVVLTANGQDLPVNVSGKIDLPVSITVENQRRQDMKASVAFLTAGRAHTPPKIDGVLDDWVMRPGDVAGEFKSLGLRGRAGEGLAKLQTAVFVLYDDQNIYIAFRCDQPNIHALMARASNIIHYDQLMAGGEDMVEIIFDPGGTAKGPEDLYHIIVKANGVLLTEKGMHTDPPLGKAEPWPVAAQVAVSSSDKIWVVEMSIPRAAFGPAGKSPFWGVNFTRFATAGSDASSWSGAPRYFYDPRNLGTMFIQK